MGDDSGLGLREPSHFPQAFWPEWNSDVAFLPGEELPAESAGKMYAVIVHLFYGDRMVMADIANRGVCVPSGRVEPGETIDDAAVRESFEETGARLDQKRRRLIGCYRMVKRQDAPDLAPPVVRYSAVFVAEATHFEPIPAGSESRGFFLIAPEDVADQYFMWDDLLAAAFAFAIEQRASLFPAGVAVRDL